MVKFISVITKKSFTRKTLWDSLLKSDADKIAVDMSTISYWQGSNSSKTFKAIINFSGAEQKVKKLKTGQVDHIDRSAEIPDLLLILPFDFFAPSKERIEISAKFTTTHIKQFLFQVHDEGKLPISEKKWNIAANFTRKYESLLILPWYYHDLSLENRKLAEKQAKVLIFWQEKAKKNGFKGILFHCLNMPAKNRASAIAALVDLIHKTQKYGLEVGFIGALQGPDIPRLLPFAPDYLVLDKKDNWRFKQNEILSENEVLTGKSEMAERKPEGFVNLDKILVSNFIVPMHIGAYAHEKKAVQRVSFNVIAEVFRPAKTAKVKSSNKSPVFSYDIILDAIRRMALEGHKELVETVAQELADFLLSFPQLAQVTVRVEKLDLAPCAVGVEITRGKI